MLSNRELKRLKQRIKSLCDNKLDNPFLAMVKKSTDFGGKYKPIPIQIGVSQGRSATFANAQANQTSDVLESFFLTRVSDYSIATIDNQTMLASRTDKMSFLEGAKLVIDGAIRSITLSLSSALFRSGTGTIGRISDITTGVITLSNANDVVQFEVGMTLQANATDGGTPRAALGYVIEVNRSAGTVTVASSGQGGSAATPTSWTTNDYLLVQGDLNAKIKGLAAWIPAAAPSATTFFGVDRTTDITRLGGNRFDGGDESIEEALIDASSLLAREGGKADVAIMNFSSYSALEKSLGSKVQYVDMKHDRAEIAFRGIMVNGANSMIKVFPDRNQLPQTAHLLQMNTWALESLGDAPQILRYGDGLEMLRVANADAGEVRVGYYAQLRTNAPGWNCHVDLSS